MCKNSSIGSVLGHSGQAMGAVRNDQWGTVSLLQQQTGALVLPVTDKLAEWQRRLVMLKLSSLQAELRGGNSARLIEQAMVLGDEVHRDRKIFVALVAALESARRVEEVQAGCDLVTTGVRQVLRRAGYCDR